MRKTIWILSLVLITGGIALTGCNKDKKDPAPADNSSNNNNNNSSNNNNNNNNNTATCPTFNNAEVIYAGNTFSVTSALLSCENNGTRYVINHGSTSGTRVRILFASQPTTAKNYSVLTYSSSGTIGADQCMIDIQSNATTTWGSVAGGSVLACTSDNVTKVKWENITIAPAGGGSNKTTAGQTGCNH